MRLEYNNLAHVYRPWLPRSETLCTLYSHEASRALGAGLVTTPPLTEAEAKSIPPKLFSTLACHSKVFHYLILNGFIPMTMNPLLAFENPMTEENNGSIVSDANNAAFMIKRMVPKSLLPKDLYHDPRQFIEGILDAKFGDDIALKPDLRASAVGLSRIKHNGDHLSVTVFHHADNHGYFQSLYEALHEKGIDMQVNPTRPYEFEFDIDLTDRDEAYNTILTLTIEAFVEWRLASEMIDSLDVEDEKPVILPQTGFVQKWQDYVKVNDRVVEGRYFVNNLDAEPQLCEGQRADGQPIDSFLKSSNGAGVVNMGDALSVWPHLHQPLIDALGLDLTVEEFNQYMEAMVLSVAKIYKQQIQSLFDIDPSETAKFFKGLRFMIDIAWKTDRFVDVPLPDSNKIVRVPEPEFVELSAPSLNFQAVEECILSKQQHSSVYSFSRH